MAVNIKGTNKELDKKESEIIEDSCEIFKIEADKNLAGWKRAMADYENLYKRMAEERTLARKEGIESSLRSLLVVLDYFDAAFSSVPADISENSWVKGVENIKKAFLDALSNQGIEPIDKINVPFDPALHEAVEHVTDGDIPAGNVINIVASGYRREDKTLRPAKVRVSNGSKENDLGPPKLKEAEEKPPESSKENDDSEEKLIN